MFTLCAAMEWAHLPVAGGIYDQHPKLIERWEILFNRKAEKQQEEAARKRAEAANHRG